MLARLCSKSFKLGFSSTWTENFQMYKLELEKAEEPEIKLPTSIGSYKKQGNLKKKIYFCFIDYAKDFVWITTNWEILKELATADHLTCLLRNLCAGQEPTVSTGHGTKGWFKIGERSMSRLYIVIQLISLLCRVCHVKCRAGWIKLESRLPKEITTISDMQMIPL